MANWKTLDLVGNLGRSLSGLGEKAMTSDRRQKRNALEDQALNFKVGTQGEQFNREGRKLNLDFSRLDHDVNSQAQDYEVAKAGLADRPVQRQHEIKSREMEGLKGIMPALPYLLGGGDPGVVGQGMEMERSRRGSIAGTTAGAAAGARDAVSKRKAREEALGRFMADPANKDIPRDQIASRFMATEMPGMRHTKPSGSQLSEGEALKRDQRGVSSYLYKRLTTDEKAAEAFDAQNGVGAAAAFVKANAHLGAGPGAQPSVSAPTPSLPTPPVEDPGAKAERILMEMGVDMDGELTPDIKAEFERRMAQ